MLSTYCQNCGSKNEYSTVKPNFCSSCGQPLAGDSAKTRASIVKPVTQTRQINEAEYDQDGTDIFEVPNISKLDYEIEVSNTNFTLGSIMPRQESQEVAPTKQRKRGRPRKNG